MCQTKKLQYKYKSHNEYFEWVVYKRKGGATKDAINWII